MTADEKLQTLIGIAVDLTGAVRKFADEATAALRAKGHVLALRDNVLLTIALKIDGAFRALVDDARQKRIEAVHHLKTIVEAFIYLHVVAKDRTDTTAKRLLARVYRDKTRFFRLNPDYDPDGMLLTTWDAAVSHLATEGITPLGDVEPEARAHGSGLERWYAAIYRAACEPAHMADLLDFMPNPAVLEIRVGEVKVGILAAIIAVDQALHAMIGTLRLMSDNQFALSLNTSPLEERLNAIRVVVTSDSPTQPGEPS